MTNEVLGVVGGLGPRASAEFLKTIYECSLGNREQDSPIVALYSDPTAPDRTEALLRGDYGTLLEWLNKALKQLRDLGASKVVICCVTIHYLLPKLSPNMRDQIISLLDVIFAKLEQLQKRHLLVCTTGTRRLGLFEAHPKWRPAREYIVLPDSQDQDAIHSLIYRVKTNCEVRELMPIMGAFLLKYGVDSFIAGCTEIHLLAKHLIASKGKYEDYGCVDPLIILAQELAERTFYDETSKYSRSIQRDSRKVQIAHGRRTWQ